MLEARVVTALLDLDLRVGAETVLITGPNAAGKSTLLRTLLGVHKPVSGRIVLDGRTLFDAHTDVPPEQRALGYVPQNYALFPHLDVQGNVAFGAPGRAREVLESMQIAHLASRRIQTLSGGEQQKVALARALAPRPKALLLDEPFAALDAQARRQLRQFVAARLAELRLPAIVVSHDIADAQVAQQIVVMERGRIAQEGSLESLREKPATAFVAEWTGSETLLASPRA